MNANKKTNIRATFLKGEKQYTKIVKQKLVFLKHRTDKPNKKKSQKQKFSKTQEEVKMQSVCVWNDPH